MTPAELIKALEEHVDLTYTAYYRDEDYDEHEMEMIRSLPNILRSLDEVIADTKKELTRYMDAIRKLAKEGVKDGSVAVLQDVHIDELKAADVFVLSGTLSLGKAQITMFAMDSRPGDNKKETP